MKPTVLSTCLLISLLAAVAPAKAQTNAPTPPLGRVVSAEFATAEATIQDIDKEKRTVTLKGQDGNMIKVKAGEDIQNFDQLKKGDRVRLDYYQSTALSLNKPGEAPPSGNERQVVSMPAQGGRGPTKMIVDTSKITATVEDVDKENRTVTLKGPEGNTVKLKVDPSVQNFDRIAKGDEVTATFTDAVGISVMPKS